MSSVLKWSRDAGPHLFAFLSIMSDTDTLDFHSGRTRSRERLLTNLESVGRRILERIDIRRI